jgi:hypothetical protein
VSSLVSVTDPVSIHQAVKAYEKHEQNKTGEEVHNGTAKALAYVTFFCSGSERNY